MKRLTLIVALIATVTMAFAAKQTVKLFVPDMECANCQGKVEKVLAYEKGVRGLEFNLERRIVTVTYEDKKTDVATLQQALIKHLNYKSAEMNADGTMKNCTSTCASSCKGHGHDGHGHGAETKEAHTHDGKPCNGHH